MEFLSGPEARDRIAALASKAKTACIAVAFWGDGAVDDLGLGRFGKGATIVCNLTAGGTNPREIRKLIATGATVLQHNTLHGKAYIFPSAAIVGSSNASANGLSRQGQECEGWEEANVHATDPAFLKKTSAWFERIRKDAREITEDDLRLASEAWSRRRHHSPRPKPQSASLLDTLRANPMAYADRRVYVAVFTSYMGDEGRAAIQKKRKKTGAGTELGGFQDWDGLPDDADLVSFYSGPRGGFDFDGYWHMPETREDIAAGRGSTVHLCYRIKKGTYPHQGADTDWKAIIERLKGHKDWDDGIIIEIGELARHYL